MNITLKYYKSLVNYHNILLGIIAFVLFILILLVQNEQFHGFSEAIRPFIDGFFFLDGAFVIIIFTLLARRPEERAILSRLNKPVLFLVVILTYILPCINIFTEIVPVLPYSPAFFFFIFLPLVILQIGKTAFWNSDTGQLQPEGHIFSDLLKYLIGTSQGISVVLIFYWCAIFFRIDLQDFRVDLIPFFFLGFAVFILAQYISIKVIWLERYVGGKEAFFCMVFLCFLLVISVYFVSRIEDWYKFITELKFLVYIYLCLILTFLSIIHNYRSRTVLMFVISIICIISFDIAIGLFVDQGTTQTIRNLFQSNLTEFKSGLVWLFGSMLGSAIFSGSLWLLTFRKHKREMGHLNEVPIEEILKARSITKPIAEEIVYSRPFHSFEDLRTRVSGIGSMRIEALRERFRL